MILAIAHPTLPDCEKCQAFMYDDAGEVVLFDGQPYKRGKVPTPCKTDVGCPKGSPDAGLVLSDKNRRAWSFNDRCKAVSRWPADPIVEMNAAIIAAAEADAATLRELARVKRERQKNP